MEDAEPMMNGLNASPSVARRRLAWAVFGATAALWSVAIAGEWLTRDLTRPDNTGNGGADALVGVAIAVALMLFPVADPGRYDADRTLDSFSEQVEIEAVSGEVVDVVRQTLQPAHVSLWLRSPEAGR
jgi:hypothetical protein